MPNPLIRVIKPATVGPVVFAVAVKEKSEAATSELSATFWKILVLASPSFKVLVLVVVHPAGAVITGLENPLIVIPATSKSPTVKPVGFVRVNPGESLVAV